MENSLNKLNRGAGSQENTEETQQENREVSPERSPLENEVLENPDQIAQNRISHLETLALLEKDGRVRRYVAQNPSTSPEILTALAEDKAISVRRHVANHPNTPLEAVNRLAEDEDRHVRRLVAKHPNTLPETLALLAEDEDRGVRRNVAENPNTPR